MPSRPLRRRRYVFEIVVLILGITVGLVNLLGPSAAWRPWPTAWSVPDWGSQLDIAKVKAELPDLVAEEFDYEDAVFDVVDWQGVVVTGQNARIMVVASLKTTVGSVTTIRGAKQYQIRLVRSSDSKNEWRLTAMQPWDT